MRRSPYVPRDERGATLVLVALCLAALMSMVALAVDVGMLMTARAEAQRTADAAALAAAGHLIWHPGEEAGARESAITLAGQTTVIGDPVEMTDEDLIFDVGAGRVTAMVRRTAERGNPLATWFARVFGVNAVDVSARAVAEITNGTGAACVKPWAVPDGWYDIDGDGHFEPLDGEYYDAVDYGYGTESGAAFRNTTYTDNGVDPPGTTYARDRGRPVRLKNEGGQSSSWRFLWAMPQADGAPAQGASNYRWNIVNCNPNLIQLGEEYLIEPGNKEGPTIQAVKQLLDADPTAEWDLASGTVINSAYDPPESSPRVVRIPLFDPNGMIDDTGDTMSPKNGRGPIVFTNMTAFFIVGLENGSDVVGRFMAMSGVGGGGGAAMPQIQFARLIE